VRGSSGDSRFTRVLLEESLVARVEENPFYLLLIERSPGLTSTDRDDYYLSMLKKSFGNRVVKRSMDRQWITAPSEPPT